MHRCPQNPVPPEPCPARRWPLIVLVTVWGVTVLGGAGSLDDMAGLFRQFGVVGAAAGSLFVFKGRFRAVLINYPGPEEKERVCGAADLVT